MSKGAKISAAVFSVIGLAGLAFGAYWHHNLHWYDEYEKCLKEAGAVEKQYELPGGRLNEYESMADGLKREIREETGLQVVAICNEESTVLTKGKGLQSSFSMECMKPYASYQTIEGPVDSFGVYFVCEAEGELLSEGDDSADIHWADTEELQWLIGEQRFSEIDLPAVLMFLRDLEKGNL